MPRLIAIACFTILQIECTNALLSMTNGCHNYRLIPRPYVAQNLHNAHKSRPRPLFRLVGEQQYIC